VDGRIYWPLLLLAGTTLLLPSRRECVERSAAPAHGAVDAPRGERLSPTTGLAAFPGTPVETGRRTPVAAPAPVDAEREEVAAPAPTESNARANVEIVVHTGVAGRAEGVRLELGYTPPGADHERVELRRADPRGRLRAAFGPGTLRIVAWDDRSVAGPVFYELAAGTSERCELMLELGREVAGRVVDAETGAPVEDAAVSFWTFAERDRARTGPDGSFRHARFPAGERAQQIRVEAAGYGAAVRYLKIEAGGGWSLPDPFDEAAARSGSGTPFVEIALVRELRVGGRVTDANGAPIEGATVSAEGYFRILPRAASRDAASTLTSATGEFALAGLRSDIGHSLLVHAPGHAEHLLELPPAPEGELSVGDVSLAREGLCAGVVIDPDGYPVEDIEVALVPLAEEGAGGTVAPAARSAASAPGLDVGARIQGTQWESRTRPDGTFLFEHLVERPYVVVVSRDREPLVEHEIRPGAGDFGSFGDLELRLPPETLTLRGELRGSAAAGARVDVERFGWVGQATVDADGRFRVAGLDDLAAYRLTVTTTSGDTGRPLSARGEAWAFDSPVLELAEAHPDMLAPAPRR